jgi:hypothetical protein
MSVGTLQFIPSNWHMAISNQFFRPLSRKPGFTAMLKSHMATITKCSMKMVGVAKWNAFAQGLRGKMPGPVRRDFIEPGGQGSETAFISRQGIGCHRADG